MASSGYPSVISYQNLTNMSDRITSIASEEVRSNALIQVHDLSKILENRLQSTTILLRTLLTLLQYRIMSFKESGHNKLQAKLHK